MRRAGTLTPRPCGRAHRSRHCVTQFAMVVMGPCLRRNDSRMRGCCCSYSARLAPHRLFRARAPRATGGEISILTSAQPVKQQTRAYILAARCARVMRQSCPSEIERAQGRPGAGRTHGPRAAKSTRQNHRYEPDIRPSLREWVTAYTRSPRGPAFLPPSRATLVKRHRSLGISTGMPGPQDFAVRAGLRPSSAALTSIAARLHVRDDRETPLCTRRDVAR